MKSLRIGIVGCGKIADGHAEVVKHLPGAKLAAVCDREPLLAEQLAVRYGVPAWYGDLAQMLERERLDVVHITTPPGVHLPITRQCVAAGAHVFLEKPLALTARESLGRWLEKDPASQHAYQFRRPFRHPCRIRTYRHNLHAPAG